MSKLNRIISIRQAISFLTIILILCLASGSQAQTPDKVTTYQDENGWKLQVNGKDYYVKGVVWGYSPIGVNYAYNLWGHSDEYIQKVLDYECKLMKKAGINTIRYFGSIPPKWVAYIYDEYGIMTIINHLMGRYGYKVGGIWRPFTDYSDELTRETLKKDIVELVGKYKDTPGVIMFALGNESNYGLEWSSFEIENLPVGERHREKAKSLYSLFNEIIHEAKKIDRNHLFTIVNGDIQYIDLVAAYCKDLDLLGVNSYRGISFTDLWKEAKQKLGLPVLFMEFGSDAYNALDQGEDEAAQAHFLKEMWREMYKKSYGNGEEGNSVGGCVFEWRDEWWKYKQTENLDVQDNTASWVNGGYSFDYVAGRNNMNEEWFGICRLGMPNADGVSEAEPRMAYYVLSEIWAIDPYRADKSKINDTINSIDTRMLALESDVRALKKDKKQRDFFSLSGGNLRGEFVFNGLEGELDEEGKDALGFDHGEMIFLDFKFQPSEHLKGDFTINILGNVPDKKLEESYGQTRGKSYTVVDATDVQIKTKEIKDNERVEFYDFEAMMNLDSFDFNTFYHVPRYHWMDEGDFYGLLREATDLEGMDIWDAKAPFGVEFIGKNSLDGLKVVVGPEVYWGANPKAIVKYTFGGGNYAFVHSEDFTEAEESATATEATERATRQTTLYAKTAIIPRTILEVGAIMAGTEKIDDKYDYIDNNNIVRDEIEFADTLGIKAKATVDAFDWAKVYVAANYAGLVADGGDTPPQVIVKTMLPYSAYGNKMEFEGGVQLDFGDITIFPRVLYRENLEEANPEIEPSITGTTLNPGINPRNRDDDPFAVLDNREALSGELFFTYDPTPGTYFYEWDNDLREDAAFAFNIGANVTKYDSKTDSYLFFYEEGSTNAAFGEGLPEETIWKGVSRMVFNPTQDLKLITKLEAGFQQSDGAPTGDTRRFYEIDAELNIGKKHTISGYIKKDAWGPYDWYRQFNITYPWQFKLEYFLRIDNLMKKYISDRIGITSGFGIKGILRTLDEDSPGDEYEDGANDYIFEINPYYSFEF